MKRIIFSIYTNSIEDHDSSSEYKREQFERYKNHLEKAQREYATFCSADYDLHITTETNYDIIQFDKLRRMEHFAQFYDEVVYMDFDMVPITKTENIFEVFDLNSICAYAFDRTPDKDTLKWALEKFHRFGHQNVYCKSCAKNAMLLLDDIYGLPTLINTGIVAGNKYSIGLLKFSENFDTLVDKLFEAKEDNIYPAEIYHKWRPNNEVFITYLIEKYNIPFTNIGQPWNFMLDRACPEPSAGAYMWHHVNKEFELSFGKS